MGFRRKCKLCEKFVTDASDAVEYKGGYVHTQCFAASLKTAQVVRQEHHQTKSKKTTSKSESVKIPKKGLTEEEHQEKTEYIQYIHSLLRMERLPAKIFAVTDKVKKQYKDFTYIGMKLTLQYCAEFLKKELGEDCVGLIPFYYDDALRYFQTIEKNENNIKSSLDVLETQEMQRVRINLSAQKNKKQLNIEEIGVKENGK